MNRTPSPIQSESATTMQTQGPDLTVPVHDIVSNRVSILIVCYRSLSLIGPCLSSIKAHTQCDYEVLLLDCSDDGTIAYVEETFPWVRLVENDENLGFAKGNNVLASYATGEYLMLLNPDTEVQGNGVGTLLACAQEELDFSAWGGVTILPTGQRDPTSMQHAPTIKNAALTALGLGRVVKRPLFPTLPESEKTYEQSDTLSGAFMLVRSTDWRILKGFDTSFFLYSEEVDLCRRLRQLRGRPAAMFNQARITHLVGESSTSDGRRVVSIHKGKMHYARKFSGPLGHTTLGIILLVHATLRLAAAVVLSPVKKGKPNGVIRRQTAVLLGVRNWWPGYQNR